MSPRTLLLVTLTFVWICNYGAYAAGVVMDTAECASYQAGASSPPPGTPSPVNGTSPSAINQTLVDWQAIVLIIALGGFALLLSLIHRAIRTYIYFDAHLLDTFFDAGGDVNFALVAASVVTRWAWTAAYAWAVLDVAKYGLVGQFWYAAALTIHLFLFSIVACEIRIKAPGAKTFLQVIYARFGAAPHVLILILALFLNLVVAGMVVYQGTEMMHALTLGVSREVIYVVLAIVIAIFTVLGGVGGTLYVAYFAGVIAMATALVYVVEVIYDPFDGQEAPMGDTEALYKVLSCYDVGTEAENDGNSALTFLSRGGMIEAVILILSGFSSMFVNQSYWQLATTAKPTHAVWGFITGGLAWFAIPFCAALGLGSAYQVYAVTDGQRPLTDQELLSGLGPVYASQRLMGVAGDYLMFTAVLVLVVSTASGEVLAAAGLIIYDIYMTYISPFKTSSGTLEYQDVSVRTRRALHNEEYLEYDRRCVMLKHGVVVVLSLLLIPLALLLMVIGVDLPYLFKLLGVVCGGCVVPVALAVTWHRVSSLGVSLGVAGGFVCGMIAWLVYGSTFPGGLERFYENTGRWEPMLAGSAVSLGVGALLCLLFSLCCGGCDASRVEEEEWEKTRRVDNPVLPWGVKYAPEFQNTKLKGLPHFYAVRRAFKGAEIAAYILGVFFSVALVLIWPACMLLADTFTLRAFNSWLVLTVVWGALAMTFLALAPLLTEVIQTCRQAYYNRKWATQSNTDTRPLEEDMSISQPERTPSHQPDSRSFKTESDFHSTIGRESVMDTGTQRERWKTFIQLD